MHMKTKKYESIMNKAMKAAMNYENPDDQINEFIRFFGEHIGSERIYTVSYTHLTLPTT